MNKENAKTLLETIQGHRAAFNMKHWCSSGVEGGPAGMITLENVDSENTKCGTTLCMAGFAALLSGHGLPLEFKGAEHTFYQLPDGLDFQEIGEEYLDISNELSDRLFWSSNNVAIDALERIASGELATEKDVHRWLDNRY